MSLLFYYLRKHLPVVALICLFFFALAQCDLALPDYMGRIIDSGLNRNGITEQVSKVFGESDYLLFSSYTDDSTPIDQIYVLVTPAEATKSDFNKYPVLNEGESVYVLNKNDLYRHHIQDLETTTKYLATSSYTKEELVNNDSTEIKVAVAQYLTEAYQRVGINTNDLRMQYIMKNGLVMLLIALMTIIITTANGFFTSRLGAKIGLEIRERLFRKIESFAGSEVDSFTTASLITRTTNDVGQVQNIIQMATRMIVYAPILAVGGIIKVFSVSADMTWLIAVGTGVIISLIVLLVSIVMPKFTRLQDLIDKINLLIRQALTGQMVIRAFNNGEDEERKFDQANSQYANDSIYVNKVMAILNPGLAVILNFVILGLVWFTALIINDGGTLQVGQLGTLTLYATQIMNAFIMMSILAMMLPRVGISLRRIKEVLNTKPSINETAGELVLPEGGNVTFDHVTFSYPGAEKPALCDISFSVSEGETVAIIGSTGSGKSTICKLLLRFYDPDSGAIALNGVDIGMVVAGQLRKRIGYVEQRPVLFSGTIRSNLTIGAPSASDEELIEALSIAQMDQFVLNTPEQLDYQVSQGGTNFSGGQKQRLAIARAIVKKPSVYLLDDSFSALDATTDAALRQELNKELRRRGASAIIIAQRVSSIIHADRIIVLEQGRIVGVGKHQQLQQECKIYQEICDSQLREREHG